MTGIPGLPSLAQGIGPVYEIGPDQLYAEPQQVWLPLPAGVRADEVRLYYYHAEGHDAGWYPAENVEG